MKTLEKTSQSVRTERKTKQANHSTVPLAETVAVPLPKQPLPKQAKSNQAVSEHVESEQAVPGPIRPEPSVRELLVRAQSTTGIEPAVALAANVKVLAADDQHRFHRVATTQLRRNLIRRLRLGSVTELSDDAAGLNGLLRNRLPNDLDARWSELRDLLTEAAQLREPSAAVATARGNRGRNMEILEALVAAEGHLPRKRLHEALVAGDAELSDSHLSHALAQLERGDLITREKHGNEVRVSITELGSEAFRQGSGRERHESILQRPNGNTSLIVRMSATARTRP